MLESVRLNRTSLGANIEAVEAEQALAVRFFQLPDSALAAVPRDTALPLLNSLFRPRTLQSFRGPISRALDGSQLTLIGDAGVLSALDEWLLQVSELEERSANLAAMELAVLTPLGEHEVFQDRTFTPDSLPPTLDLRPVRDDPDVMGAATTMVFQRLVYYGWVMDTMDSLTRLEELLDSHVE